MREGIHDRGLIVINGQFVGVNLGWDFCAEHEWGISGIRACFRMNDEGVGVDRRIVKRVPVGGMDRSLYLAKITKSSTRAIYLGYEDVRNRFPMGKQDLWTAWSEESFAVVSDDKTTKAHLTDLSKAFHALDAVIWLGGNDGNPFSRNGLIIAVASRLPAGVSEMWKEFDLESMRLKEDFKATGIEEILHDAGKEWFALRPARKEDGSLVVFLNPTEQKIHNFGWFTIDQLKEWAEDRGPVMKDKGT